MNQTSLEKSNGTKPAEEPPAPKVFTVALVDGSIWQLGESVPGTDETGALDASGNLDVGKLGKQAIKVLAMHEQGDGSVKVYGMPVPGSNYDEQKTAFVITLSSHTIRSVVTAARFDVWHELLEDEEFEDDEEEEIEEDVKPQNVSNGATS
jgi:hypothetical protein